MKHPDSYYLQNEVIAAIFKGNDPVLVSHVFTCLERKYKTFFFSRVVIHKHYLLAQEVLAAIAQEAFSEMQRIFYDQVRKDEFQTTIPGVSNYLFKTFLNQYRNFYRKEMTYKKYDLQAQQKMGSSENISADTPVLNKPEGIYNAIRMAINKLKQDCRELITLKVLQNENEDEITAMTGLKNKHAANQQTFRCKQQLKQILMQEFGIEL